MYLILNIISHFSNISFFLFDNAAHIPCVRDDDCPKRPYPQFMKCVDNFCETWIIGWE